MNKPLEHSIENIYSQVGQYDRYAVFDFYFGSDAYKIYGQTVSGLLIYTPSERAILEDAIMPPSNNSNNDGVIRLDNSLKDDDLNSRLRTKGFNASDVIRLSTIDSGPIKKSFKAEGVKEIPNTINITFKSTPNGPWGMELLNLENRIRDGVPLIPYEERKYLSLKFMFNPSDDLLESIKEHLIDKETGVYYNDVIITWYGYYYNVLDKDNAEVKSILNAALRNRRIERTSFILKHLGISNKHVTDLKEKDIKSWKELMKVVLGFEPAVIEVWGWKYPVWWDFERFIHIYLRHYKNFFIEGSSKGQGTSFQYHNKDIRRVISIVIKNNQKDIEVCLADRKPYNKYGEQGYYYNGNYYTFRIDGNGRLMQFHPQEV